MHPVAIPKNSVIVCSRETNGFYVLLQFGFLPFSALLFKMCFSNDTQNKHSFYLLFRVVWFKMFYSDNIFRGLVWLTSLFSSIFAE
jgi:hypothetical protein